MDSRPQISNSSATPALAGAVMTQAEFAKHRGVSEAMVSRWKTKGYLVFTTDRRVDVAASMDRLDRMLDPARGGDRTGRQRPYSPAGAAGVPQAPPGAGSQGGAPGGAEGGWDPDPDRLNYQREAARDKRASAMQRELELAREAGQLVRANEAASRIANHVRQALDSLAARRRRLAPKLALEADPRKVEQLLEESDREFCIALANLVTGQPTEAPAE